MALGSRSIYVSLHLLRTSDNKKRGPVRLAAEFPTAIHIHAVTPLLNITSARSQYLIESYDEIVELYCRASVSAAFQSTEAAPGAECGERGLLERLESVRIQLGITLEYAR